MLMAALAAEEGPHGIPVSAKLAVAVTRMRRPGAQDGMGPPEIVSPGVAFLASCHDSERRGEEGARHRIVASRSHGAVAQLVRAADS